MHAFVYYEMYCEDRGYKKPISFTCWAIKMKRYVHMKARKRKGRVDNYYYLNDEGMKLHEQIQKQNDDVLVDDDEETIYIPTPPPDKQQVKPIPKPLPKKLKSKPSKVEDVSDPGEDIIPI